MPEPTPKREADRPIALVTGGGGGIGRAIVERLADRAMCVVVHYHRDAAAAAAAVDAVERLGGQALAVRADLSEAGSAGRLLELIRESWGEPTALVNNAAWDPGWRALDEQNEAFVDRLLAVNLRGPLMLVRELARGWRASGRGAAVVNVGSVQSRYSLAGHAAYAASKGGLESVTRQLAVELGPYGVRVNHVAPGFIDIPRTRHASPPRRLAEVARRTPLGRAGTPADVAGVVAFLLSDDAAFVTGQSLTIDGGAVCQLSTHDHPRPQGAHPVA